jgi:hypothetical protein
MDFLDCVDFENHDGVYLSMLNDVARNHFYDQILTENKNLLLKLKQLSNYQVIRRWQMKYVILLQILLL